MNKTSYSTKSKRKERKRIPNLVLTAGLLAALIAILAILQLTGMIHLLSRPAKELTGTTASEATKGENKTSNADNTSSSQTSTTPSSPPANEKTEGNTTNQTTLIIPSGNFVSSHHVSLGDGGNIVSACNTTPGSKCRIYFTKDGVVKSLVTKTADAGGATYWNWTLQQTGLTPGSWQITAEATLNNNKQTATDALNLEVKE